MISYYIMITILPVLNKERLSYHIFLSLSANAAVLLKVNSKPRLRQQIKMRKWKQDLKTTFRENRSHQTLSKLYVFPSVQLLTSSHSW
jgi:hypothetical protein